MQRWMAFAGIGLAGTAGTTLVMAEPSTRTYPLPLEVARERLASAPVPGMLLGVTCGPATLVRAGDTLIWQLGDRGAAGQVTAELSADGQSTRVRLTTDIKSNPLGGALTASKLYAGMADDIFAEYVGSAIVGRPFDPARFGQRSALRMQAGPSSLSEFGEGIRAKKEEVRDIITQDESFDRDAGGFEATLADLEDRVKAEEAYEATRSARKKSTTPTTNLIGY